MLPDFCLRRPLYLRLPQSGGGWEGVGRYEKSMIEAWLKFGKTAVLGYNREVVHLSST